MKRIIERANLIRPLLIPLILYIGTLTLSMNWQFSSSNNWTTWLLIMSPLLPGFFLAGGIIKAINQLDELERRIILEAAAFSFLVTLLLMIAAGLLNRAGIQTPNPIYFALIMALTLLFGKLFLNRRYK